MFTLITGVPGSGKTLWLINELKNGMSHNGLPRQIYYSGIPGLNNDLGWIQLLDPKNYHDEVPDGSIIVIDECQKLFPVRPPKNAIPPSISAIETHRHRGLDIYFITQDPRLLDHHARRLTGQHCHLKRNFGANFSILYRSNECINDPQDQRSLRKAEKTTFKHPKETFDLYKSAEIHTHKFRIPKILFYIPVLFIFIGISFYFFYNTLFSDPDPNQSITNPLNIKKQITDKLKNNNRQKIKNITINDFIPQLTNIPATSPFYSNLWKPLTPPIISSCYKTKNNCRCFTQQATIISTTQKYCLSIINNGSPYDHTRPNPKTKNRQNKI